MAGFSATFHVNYVETGLADWASAVELPNGKLSKN